MFLNELTQQNDRKTPVSKLHVCCNKNFFSISSENLRMDIFITFH